eukprot:TRINITY_DN66573_c0_g1_i1.p1 TRINITY_DN66573_c0_g1~~TRINITY_DN66573_c0_g1_i1.p1  ORF type:complete len:1128 (-),score=158.23 TRINITY_DN66573_c0_g1_i1:56-3439(-)
MQGRDAKGRFQSMKATSVGTINSQVPSLLGTAGASKGPAKRSPPRLLAGTSPGHVPSERSSELLRPGNSSAVLRPLTSVASAAQQLSGSQELLRPGSSSAMLRPLISASQPVSGSPGLPRPGSSSTLLRPLPSSTVPQLSGSSPEMVRPGTSSSMLQPLSPSAKLRSLGPLENTWLQGPSSLHKGDSSPSAECRSLTCVKTNQGHDHGSAGWHMHTDCDNSKRNSSPTRLQSSVAPPMPRSDVSPTTRLRRPRATHRQKRPGSIASIPPALDFDQIFKLSYKRAVKAAASKRQCGKNQSTASGSSQFQLKGLLEARRILKERCQDADFLVLNSRARQRSYAPIDDNPPSQPSSQELNLDPKQSRGGSRRSSVTLVRHLARLSRGSIFGAPPKLREVENLLKGDEKSDNDDASDDGPEELSEVMRPPDKDRVVGRLSRTVLSDEEEKHIWQVFSRYLYEQTDEIHEESVTKILDQLGYFSVSQEAAKEILSETTTYATLSFPEFVQYIKKVTAHEREVIRKRYQESDADGSGTIDINELADLLKSIGIYPFRSTVEGALAVVDEDLSGELDFNEFVLLLAIYGKTEGFSREEVRRLFRVFVRFSETPDSGQRRSMKISNLSLALLYMFGNQVSSLISVITENAILSTPAPKPASNNKTPNADQGKLEQTMDFPDFLRWSRRLREAEIQMYHDEFDRCDADGGGSLDSEEIRAVLFNLGYTPLKAVVFDLIDTFDVDQSGTLDFDEFVSMMQLFRKTDGFTRAEIELFKEAYQVVMHEYDSSGELDAVGVSAALQHLGYDTDIKEVDAMVKAVDCDNSKKLNFLEFLRFMRLHRENELHHLARVFSRYAADADGNSLPPSGGTGIDLQNIQNFSMKRSKADGCLQEMDIPQSASNTMLSMYSGMCGTQIDFDALVGLLDGSRKILQKEMRKQGGFSARKVEAFRKRFEELDDDGSGTLEGAELTELCRQQGLQLQTKSDQKQLLDMISQARENAHKTGWKKDEVGEEGPETTFPVFLHLMRLVRIREDKRFIAEAASASDLDLGFSTTEIRELKTLFDRVLRVRGLTEQLDTEGLWDVLRSLNIELTPMQKHNLKVKQFTVTNGSDRTSFKNFLQLLAWIIKTDFAKTK